jgi:hypothetical protein
MNGRTNYLKAAFWDYPELADEQILRERLRQDSTGDFKSWALRRFLEHARVIDVLKIFSIKEITEVLGKIKLSDYSRQKWQRMIEVYGSTGRR